MAIDIAVAWQQLIAHGDDDTGGTWLATMILVPMMMLAAVTVVAPMILMDGGIMGCDTRGSSHDKLVMFMT